MDFSRVAALTAGIGIIISTAHVAQAAFVMTLDDLSTAGVDVILSDGLGVGGTTSVGSTTAADVAMDGFINFNGGVGSFTVNVVTGLSDPLVGPGKLDLNSLNVSGAAGNLVIGLTDTDYIGAVPAYTANFGGNTTGSVDFNFLHDATNNEFGGISVLDPAPIANVNPFSGSGTSAVGTGSPYSLTIEAAISHTAAGQTSSFDAHLVPVPIPVPTAVWLFGSGLLGMVAVCRRRS